MIEFVFNAHREESPSSWFETGPPWWATIIIGILAWAFARMYERSTRWDEHVQAALCNAYGAAYAVWTAYDDEGNPKPGLDAADLYEKWKGSYAGAVIMAKYQATSLTLNNLVDRLGELRQVETTMATSSPSDRRKRVSALDAATLANLNQLEYRTRIELRRDPWFIRNWKRMARRGNSEAGTGTDGPAG